MNKRVAILTTHRANNFGAVLQAFSLVSAAQELGVNAQVLDWRCPYFEKLYRSRFTEGAFIKVVWRNFWRFFIERPVRKKFDVFRYRISQSQPFLTRSELTSSESDYDSFVVGSDQVWNPLNTAPATSPETFDRAYLLDFVHDKPKHAYAASIGVSCIASAPLLQEFVDAWLKFDIISMREHEGAEYVWKTSGRPACAVVDPVLLHDAVWWLRRCQASIVLPERYIFEYNVKQVEGLHLLAKKKGKEIGAEVIKPLIPGQTNLRSNVFFTRNMGPEDFVHAIKNAQCVFSSSFHCAAFAFLFKKKLYLARKTDMSAANTRFAALLRFTGAAEQVVETRNGVDYLLIDFSVCDDANFASVRNSSWNVLRQIVGMNSECESL